MKLILFLAICISLVHAELTTSDYKSERYKETKTNLELFLKDSLAFSKKSMNKITPGSTNIAYDSRESHKAAIAIEDIESEESFLNTHFTYVEDFTKGLGYKKDSVAFSKIILEKATKDGVKNALYCPVEAELFAIIEIKKESKKNIHFFKEKKEEIILKELENIENKKITKIYCGLIKTNKKNYYYSSSIKCADINMDVPLQKIMNMFEYGGLKVISLSFGSLKNKRFCYTNKTPINFVEEVKEEPVYNKGLTIGCNGISYSGVFEQNIIDRLKNMKDILNVTLKPYTMCCNKDTMSELQKYARVYGLSMCLQEISTFVMSGNFSGHQFTGGVSEIISSCSHNAADGEINGGVRLNSSLITGGGKLKMSLSGAMNFSGCVSKKFSELGLIDKFNTCINKEADSFMKIVEDMASQQITLDISLSKFKADQCIQEIEDPKMFDLSIPLPFTDENKSSEGSGIAFRMEDEVNMYGVLKKGSLYSPVLMLQHKAAYLETNAKFPVKEKSIVPSYILSELKRKLNVNDYTAEIKKLNQDLSNNCKQDSYKKIKARLELLLKTSNEEKTIDMFLYLYANNTLHLSNNTFNDIGLFASSCKTNDKTEILEIFNKVLDGYIDEYTNSTPNNFFDAEKNILTYSNKSQKQIKKALLSDYKIDQKIELEQTRKDYIINNINRTCKKFYQTEINKCIEEKKKKANNIQTKIENLEKQKTSERSYTNLNKDLLAKNNLELELLNEEKKKFAQGSESPMFLMKIHLEIYQNFKINKEREDFESYRKLKSALGIE